MEFHRIDPDLDPSTLREFLSASDPDDYLLEDLAEWVRSDRLWAGMENGEWVAFGRLHDLGFREGWVSGIRVRASRRNQGLGAQLLDGLLGDARSVGLTSALAPRCDGPGHRQ